MTFPHDSDTTASAASGKALALGPSSLIGVDIRKLLKVSPRVHTIQLAPAVTKRSGPTAQSQSAIAEVEGSDAVPSSTTNADDLPQGTGGDSPSNPPAVRRSVTLIAEAADFQEVMRLQSELGSEGIDAASLEGHLAGSNLVVKLEPKKEGSIILFCLGQSVARLASNPEGLRSAVGEFRIPVIMKSVQGDYLNRVFLRDTYFDIREEEGFKKLVTYLTSGTFEAPDVSRRSPIRNSRPVAEDA